MRQSTISMAIFNSFLYVQQRVSGTFEWCRCVSHVGHQRVCQFPRISHGFPIETVRLPPRPPRDSRTPMFRNDAKLFTSKNVASVAASIPHQHAQLGASWRWRDAGMATRCVEPLVKWQVVIIMIIQINKKTYLCKYIYTCDYLCVLEKYPHYPNC